MFSYFPTLVALPPRLEHLNSLFWSRNVVETALPPNFYPLLIFGITLCMMESLELLIWCKVFVENVSMSKYLVFSILAALRVVQSHVNIVYGP